MEYILLACTPGAEVEAPVTTAITEAEVRTKQFEEHDPSGVGMTLIAMSVVLGALAVLFLIFKGVGLLVSRHLPSKASEFNVAPSKGNDRSFIAAITLALHEYADQARDQEEGFVTIEQISRRYSPWSSKSLSINHNRLRR